MDILALGFALTANQETETPVPADPGFEEALAQIQEQLSGPPPSSGPPGPEPPGAPTAGEGVANVEPNALSKKPDFLPLPEIDVEMPTPFWEPTTPDQEGFEVESAPGTDTPSDQAVELLMSQFTAGLFAAPQAVIEVPAVEEPSVQRVSNIESKAVATPKPENPVPGTDAPVGTPDVILPKAPSAETPEPKVMVDVPVDAKTPEGQDRPEFEVTKEVASALGIEKVVADEPTDVRAETQKEGTSVLGRTKPHEETTPTVDALLKKQPVETKQPTSENAPEKVADASMAQKVERADKPLRNDPETGVKGATAEPAARIQEPKASGDANTKQDGEKKEGDGQKGLLGSTEKTVKAENVESVEKPQIVVPVDSAAPRADVNPVAAKPLEQKEVSEVVKQVADRLQMLAAARPKHGVTIHLNPDDLGTLTVVVKSIGRQVDTKLFASDERVREALDQNQLRLTEAMSSRGYQLQSVTVSQQPNNSTSSQSRGDWQNQNFTPNGQSNQSGERNQEGGYRHRSSHHGGTDERGPSRRWAYAGSAVDIEI